MDGWIHWLGQNPHYQSLLRDLPASEQWGSRLNTPILRRTYIQTKTTHEQSLCENSCYFPILQIGEWRPTKVMSFAHGESTSDIKFKDWHPDLHSARAHSLNPLWEPDSTWNVGLLWSGLYQLHHLISRSPAIHAPLLSDTLCYFASQHPRLGPCRMWAIWE